MIIRSPYLPHFFNHSLIYSLIYSLTNSLTHNRVIRIILYIYLCEQPNLFVVFSPDDDDDESLIAFLT